MRVLVLAAAVAVAPLPVFAGEGHVTPSPGPGIKASAEKAVVEAARRAPEAPRYGQAGQADLSSPSFFKTRAGIVALVLTGVALGATLYSTSNDRVKSPGRE